MRVGFAIIVEFGIADQAVFDDLGIAGAHFPVGQRSETIGVDQDKARLMKGSCHIFASQSIDGDLAADAAVDLRDE